MNDIIILLEDGTTGNLVSIEQEKDFAGFLVTIELIDENGNYITKTGKVKEIL